PLPPLFPYTTLFRSDEEAAALLVHVVDRHDVLVVEPRRGDRLLLEPRELLRVAREVARQDLDRHPALEEEVLGEVDAPHPALAEDRKSTRLNSSHQI